MPSNLFSAGQIGTMTLPNRVIRSATQDPFGHRDGTCAPEQVALYRDIAAAGTGAIITAYSYISPEARSTGIQVGFATEEQRASQKEVLDAVHEAGGRLILQLMHAGMNVFMPEKHVAGGKLLAPTGGLKAPNDMETTEITAEDMAKIKADFVDAAKAAKELGFDGIQLHCAHGYLLSSFLTPISNTRTDEYGGSLENRLRYPLEVFDAVRAAWPADKPMFVRISATDWVPDGISFEDVLEIARAFKAHGVDVIDVSSGQTTPLAKPEYGRSYQTPFADRIRNIVGIDTMAVGAISSWDDVNTNIAAGRSDLCAIGRPHIYDPQWTLHAAADQGVKVDWPTPYVGGSWKPPAGRSEEPKPRLELVKADAKIGRPSRWKP